MRDSTQVLFGRALDLQARGRLSEAECVYREILQIDPAHAAVLNMFGVLCAQTERGELAEQYLRRSLDADVNEPLAHNNLGIVLTNLLRLDAAVQCFDNAIALRPDYAEAFCNRGVALASSGRIAEGTKDFRQARALNPRFALAQYQEAICLLQAGDYGRGWPLYESRKQLFAPFAPAARVPPEWQGHGELSGRRLFLYGEHGLGDVIQFCRFARIAKNLGADVILAVLPQLHRLLRSLHPGIEMAAPTDGFCGAELQQGLLSMPLAMKTRGTNIPAEIPYLSAEPERVAKWRARLGGRGFAIGVCWETGPGLGLGPWSRARSFPLSILRPLAAVPGVRLISLQRGATRADSESAGVRIEHFDDLDAGPDAFVDSAALACSLNLVITSDTAMGHLCGALGRPTWLALQFMPDWRWQLGRADSPWYPTLRLFRQTVAADWTDVFATMRNEVERLAGGAI